MENTRPSLSVAPLIVVLALFGFYFTAQAAASELPIHVHRTLAGTDNS